MSDITTALDTIRQYRPEKQLLTDYYNGNHRLLFATDKFRDTFGQILKTMRDNLCPIVVDAASDRMEILNFSGDDESKETADRAWQLWKREQMELVSNSTHSEVLKTGEAYLIVWPDDTKKAKFYLQDSRNCAVITNQETGAVLFAAKLWPDREGKLRLTLYYPDRILRFVSTNKIDKTLVAEIKESSFQKVAENPEMPNPYGVVPVFKFEANPVLADAIPLQ
ncbi:MAG TPA: phage portal protein, partial [Pyrinomonadaceae bacterium]|nr:phage portal protein [Pyrinomonadaceae bacterium]